MSGGRNGLLCTVTWLSLVSLAAADGVMLDGSSPRAIGRGGTNIAHADNGGVWYDNPGGAVRIEGETLVEIGVDMLLPDFRYRNPRNDSAADNSLFPTPQVSLIRKSSDGQWAYGLGFYVPAGFAETYDLEGPDVGVPPLVGGDHRYKSFGALMKALPGIAYRATDRLSVGATLGVAVSHGELEGPYFLQSPGLFQGMPTLLDLQATGATLCWSFGLQYELSEATTLGLAYQSESRFHLDGATRVRTPFGPSAFDTTMDITWPQSVGLGVRHELCPHRILSADLIWTDWSQAFDDFGLHLRNATNPAFRPFGTIRDQFPLNWRDTLAVRLGLEQVLEGGRVLRLGYVYHRNPIPDETLTPFIQATLTHAFSAGYGWVCRGWNVDLAYMFSFGPDRTVEQSDFVGGDFDQSFHRAQTHCIAFSFMRQW